jgi:hypothetical protein
MGVVDFRFRMLAFRVNHSQEQLCLQTVLKTKKPARISEPASLMKVQPALMAV